MHGEVVWSAAEQRGYLRIAGLPVNDPKARQYQLWIFDARRDERYPVDSGVFDVTMSTLVIYLLGDLTLLLLVAGLALMRSGARRAAQRRKERKELARLQREKSERTTPTDKTAAAQDAGDTVATTPTATASTGSTTTGAEPTGPSTSEPSGQPTRETPTASTDEPSTGPTTEPGQHRQGV